MLAGNLLATPLEVAGAWGGSSPGDAAAVLTRMRQACLAGVRLVSDRQPSRLRVEDHSSGPPAVWLHADPPETAWVIVDIGPRDWSKLAYQFGHELGHVLCNSWARDAKPAVPCQWILGPGSAFLAPVRGRSETRQRASQAPPLLHDQNRAGNDN